MTNYGYTEKVLNLAIAIIVTSLFVACSEENNTPTVGSLTLNLDELEELGTDYVYEGWIVLNGTPVSTGTFLTPNGADDNAATSPYKGTTSNGPGFPGEDYLIGSAAGVNFPTDLKGATVVVSVEPYPDNSPAPFTLKPLAHVVTANAIDHTVINMGVGPLAVLSGTVSR